MPHQLHAYLRPTALPDAATVQRALDALRLDLRLQGHWPPQGGELHLVLHGEPVAVQATVQAGARWPTHPAAEADDAQHTLRLALHWADEPRHQVAALGLTTALAQVADARVLDPVRAWRIGVSALATAVREIHAEQC